ncbi:GNAT family N-acetyltransferase [Kribbella lupini]|uniref:GNAT family N-acetyltransferase n=1 Tax=Kribbella lupini TaxID=291602 RepID=UPI0031DE44CE
MQALVDSPDAFLGDAAAEKDYGEKYWHQELSRNVWLVATYNGTGIGLAKLNCAADDGVHVEALWVAPGRRRRGVGRQLMSAVEDVAVARGVRQLKLWIFTENDAARAFYLKLSYQETPYKQPIKANGRIMCEEEYAKHL